MGALHMLRDLNELQDELHQSQPFKIYSSPYTTSYMTPDAVANGGMDMSMQQHSSQQMSNMKRFLHSQEQPSLSNTLPSWQIDLSNPDERTFTPHMLGYCDVTPGPWLHGQTIPRDISPDGYWNGGRSAMEPESCSGSSAWSDRTSEGHPEYETNSSYGFATWGSQRSSIASQFDAGFSPGVANDQSFGFSNPGSCIAPCDVQQYPDAASEDAYRKPEIQELESSTSYFMGPPQQYRPRTESVHLLGDDEGIASSIHDGSIASLAKVDVEDDDAIMEDDVKEDGGDSDVSDYTPTITKRSSTRRTSRTKVPTSPTITKRGSRSKASPTRTKSSKITKRPSKSSSSPTSPAITSNSSSSKHKTPCPHCSYSFPSPSALAKHILTTHTRPFTCPFTRYGCPATFGSKNEWKRHVSSQHLRLGIYRCDIGSCVPRIDTHRRKSSSSSTASKMEEAGAGVGHNDFNRKDLFTQHIRRMHGPTNPKDTAAFDATLERIRQRCWLSLRSPPPQSLCGYCPTSSATSHTADHQAPVKPLAFAGPTSWDERMEHVARHLEQGTAVKEEREDIGLRDWMIAEGLLERVGAGWRVVGVGGRRRRGGSKGDAAVDAGEGEDEEDAVGDEE